MPVPALRAVIFDIGRVLVRVDISAAMAGLAERTRLTPQEVWVAIERHPRWRDWQEGRLAPPEWHRHLGQRLGTGLAFEQFCEVWNRALSSEPIIPEELLTQLARRFRLAVLSNTDPLHVAHLEAQFPLLRHFPQRIYSCGVGACKPEPLIYKEALRACGVRAEEALYIDDIAAYVEAAQRLGMAGVVFESPTQLEQELAVRGLLTPGA
ncbi:MAG: HAD family phosphatase [Acidobacteriia bacterium]|nr:HAD family phosphatase [Terriglobia bacterium]